MYIIKHYAEKIFYVEKCISNPDKYLMHLNEIDKNTTHYLFDKYNRICYTNITIKQPYYCYISRKKCKMCSDITKSFRYIYPSK